MNSTKERVAQAFKELVCKKSFQKITISDIARECEMTRENFYYHFHDKYDIIRWIMEYEVVASIPEQADFEEWMKYLIHSFGKEVTFYKRILREIGKETIHEHFYPVVHEKVHFYVELSARDSAWNMRKEKIDFVTMFYSSAITNFVMDSVLNYDKTDLELFDSNLSFLIKNYLPFVRS